MTAISQLVDFLLARIAEDEADARSRAGLADHHVPPHEGYPVFPGVLLYTVGDKRQMVSVLTDPTRLLAEVGAKRRIVLARSLHPDFIRSSETQALASSVLGHMARLYSNHPDYRQEWAP